MVDDEVTVKSALARHTQVERLLALTEAFYHSTETWTHTHTRLVSGSKG